MDVEVPMAPEEIANLLGSLKTSVDATSTSLGPLLQKAIDHDKSLETDTGLSLLLLRPHVLLSSLHQLVILLALRLQGVQVPEEAARTLTTYANTARPPRSIGSAAEAMTELTDELRINQEVMDKVRGLESKLEYQIKKLSGLADAAETREKAIIEDAEEDPLSFKPNAAALLADSGPSRATSRAGAEGAAEPSDEIYRPRKSIAVPYNEPGPSGPKRKERRAPALLSEFAQTMDSAPLLESTSGLSTRPVQANRHTNSVSAKRAAELARINAFEEENMTRLVTTKREAKRRREDEEALALGYGVGGPAKGRGRRQNGLEAEMEGVLGERGSRGLWEGVSKGIGKREGLLERGRSTGGDALSGGKKKKARFAKDVKKRR